MCPAHQRFRAHDLTRRQGDLGLVVHRNLPGLDGLAELRHELEAAQEQVAHRRRVGLHRCALGRRAHGDVRALQQRVGVRILGLGVRFGRVADDRGGLDREPVHGVGNGKPRPQLLRRLVRGLGTRVVEERGERATLQACQRNVGAQGVAQPASGRDDHAVAPGLAQRVGHGRQDVEVDPQHHALPGVVQRLGARLAEAGPVQQAGQRVVVGVVTKAGQQAPVVDGRREVRGQGPQQLDVRLAETAPAGEPVVRLDRAEQLGRPAQRNDQRFLRVTAQQGLGDVLGRVGHAVVAHVGAGQLQDRILAHCSRVGRGHLVGQRFAGDEGDHGFLRVGAQAQHDPVRVELLADAFRDELPLVLFDTRRQVVVRLARAGAVLSRPRDAKADLAQRLEVALFPQQARVGEVGGHDAREHQDDQGGAPRRGGDDLVADEAGRGVQQRHDERLQHETDAVADAHRLAHEPQRAKAQHAREQRHGDGADERTSPERPTRADHLVHGLGGGERDRDLHEHEARVVDGPVEDPPAEQRAHARDHVRGEHDLERCHQKSQHQRDLGEGDRPGDAAADVDVDRELFRQQEADDEKWADPEEGGVLLLRQPGRDHARADDTGHQKGDGERAERAVGRLGRPGGRVRHRGRRSVGHPASSSAWGGGTSRRD